MILFKHQTRFTIINNISHANLYMEVEIQGRFIVVTNLKKNSYLSKNKVN